MIRKGLGFLLFGDGGLKDDDGGDDEDRNHSSNNT